MKIKNLATAFFATTTLVACAVPAPTPINAVTKVRLPMGYIPNIQYAPYYVAVSKGYFAQEKIEIEFDYKFETDGVKLVGAGELPFAVVSGEQVVLARDKGLPVKYVAQWYRKFPVAVITPTKANVSKLADLKGKKIGLPGFFGATYVGWRALLNANGLNEKDFDQQEIGFTQVAALQQNKVDAVIGYSVNEPIVLTEQGVPVTVIEVGRQLDMVANGLLTSEKMIKENPALIKAMVRALVRGIQDTIANPDEAMLITTKYVEGLKTSDVIQKKVLLATIENMQALSGMKIGESSATAWDNTQNILLTMGQIKAKREPKDYFTNEFLP
jgi:NitT/TauT family transport system substrate-binding protein